MDNFIVTTVIHIGARGRPELTTASNVGDAKTVRNSGVTPKGVRRFDEFAQRCLEFCNEMIEADGTLSKSTSDETLDFNMHLSKTIFGKWSPEIFTVLYMAAEPVRFEDLRKAIGPISPQVLSRKLGMLEQQGLVDREVLPTRPTRVRYSLTEHGWRVTLLGQPIVLYMRLIMDEGGLLKLAGGHAIYPNGLPTPGEHRRMINEKAFARDRS